MDLPWRRFLFYAASSLGTDFMQAFLIRMLVISTFPLMHKHSIFCISMRCFITANCCPSIQRWKPHSSASIVILKSLPMVNGIPPQRSSSPKRDLAVREFRMIHFSSGRTLMWSGISSQLADWRLMSKLREGGSAFINTRSLNGHNVLLTIQNPPSDPRSQRHCPLKST